MVAKQVLSTLWVTRAFPVLLVGACALLPRLADAQTLTGVLVGTVKDEQGAVLPDAQVRVTSSELIGGPAVVTTNGRGQLRFPILPPGTYVLDIELPGFAPYHESDIRIGAGATLERTVVLRIAGIAESVVVQEPGSRIEARAAGSRCASDPNTCGRSPHVGSACSIRSEPLRVSHRRRRPAAR
jgi:hypothetical protein